MLPSRNAFRVEQSPEQTARPSGRKARRPGRIMLLAALHSLVLLGAALLAGAADAQEASRHALVIGNGEYRTVSRLKNPANDARAVAAALMAAQFEVTTVIDGTRREMDRAIDELMSSIEAGGVGLFYFAGHGVQVGGQNYLIPIDDERIQSQSDLKYEAVNASALVDAMRLAGNPLNIVIMDACRNNPLPAESRSASTGLGRMETGSGMFVSFATSPGAVALDGKGGNSPYSENLVKALATPGLSIEAVFKQTLRGTHDDTGGKQVPWISSSFFGEFAFLPGEAVTDEVEMVALDTGEIEVPVIEPVAEDGGVVAADEDAVAAILASLPGLYRVEGTNPDGSAYEGTVTVAALSDERLGLEWRTGGETLYDEGWIDGRWLTLGDEAEGTRAVYTLEADGSIEGTFDETGTERIAPVASPIADGVPTGSYAMTGEYRSGDVIDGTVEIAALEDGEDGLGVIFDWNGDAYEATAVTKDGLLAIEWDDGTTLTFGRGADGALIGLSSDLNYRIELQPGEAAADVAEGAIASLDDLVGIYAMGGNYTNGTSITGTVAIYPAGEKYMFTHQWQGERYTNTAEIENGRLVVRWEGGTDGFDLVRTASLEQVVSASNYATMTLDRVAGPIADPSRLGLFELTRGGAEGEARTIRVGAIDVDQGAKLVVPSEVTWWSGQGNIMQLTMEGESWLVGEDADGALVGFASSAAGEATAAVERIASTHDGTMPEPGVYALASSGKARTFIVTARNGQSYFRAHAQTGEEAFGRLEADGGALTLVRGAGPVGRFWSAPDGNLWGMDAEGEAALVVQVAGRVADPARYEGLYVEFFDVGNGPVRTGDVSAIIASKDGVRYESAVEDGTTAVAPVKEMAGALRLGSGEFRIDYGEAPGGVLAGPLNNGISMMVPLAGLAAFEAENVRDTPAADASTE